MRLDLPGWACPSWLGFLLVLVFIIAYCNLLNFMDGVNGLAAGQGTLTGAALAFLLWKCRVRSLDLIAAAVSRGATGFLPHNFPSARILGGVALGFLLALVSQVAHALGGVPWTTILLIHSVFLLAGFTLLKRAWRGENFFLPPREHNYQF